MNTIQFLDIRDLQIAVVDLSADEDGGEPVARRRTSVKILRTPHCQLCAYQRATKLRDSLWSALQMFPSEVATSGAQWKERCMQKVLSQLARARIFIVRHKQYLDFDDHIAAAVLLSTAAPGAMSWFIFNDFNLKADMLYNDKFCTALRFSLVIDQTNLVAAAAEIVSCGHCDTAFPPAKHYQVHALTIVAGSAGGSVCNTHNFVVEAVPKCAKEIGVVYLVGSTFRGVRTNDPNCLPTWHLHEQREHARRQAR